MMTLMTHPGTPTERSAPRRPSPQDKVWRAFYTRPRHELKVAVRLEEAGLEVYCPTTQIKVKWSDRWKKVTKVLFTSYVFVRVDEKERIQVLEDQGVSCSVQYLGKPATIRDEEIEAIRRLIEGAEDVELRPFEPGTAVRISDGPLKGTAGTLLTYTNANKAILRIEALGTEIHATLTPAQLEALQQA